MLVDNLFSALFQPGEFLTTLFFVATAGFLDGIHPCAIAILIFFVAFLLTLETEVSRVWWLGLVYIAVIFLTYLGIGVGLLSGLTFFGRPHFFARLGALVLVLLGTSYLFRYFFPEFLAGFDFPGISRDWIRGLLKKASLPAVAGGAFLVGLCSVPCSGGIYAAINALLASRTTFVSGFFYLVVYNLMFVSPLLLILVLSFNSVALVKFGEWQQKYQEHLKVIIGLGLIVLGTAFYIFVI